jgi:4'-phosphopantetheinyl transferase EntD
VNRVAVPPGFPPFLALATDAPGANPWLSDEERAIHAGVPYYRRSDWRAGRLAMKRAAAAVLDMEDLDRLETSSVPGCAPRVTVRSRGYPAPDVSITLSLSHRDGRAAAAAGTGRMRVGVDLERAGAVGRGRERYFLTVAEQSIAASRDATELWALKEAAWKALGCHAALPFTSLELGFDGVGDVVEIRIGGVVCPARAVLTRPWAGYVLAVFWSPEAAR